MHRLFIAAIIAASFVATAATADAGWNRHKHHAHAKWHGPVAMRQIGPPWAGPNQCFTDLGYGRYESCDK